MFTNPFIQSESNNNFPLHRSKVTLQLLSSQKQLLESSYQASLCQIEEQVKSLTLTEKDKIALNFFNQQILEIEIIVNRLNSYLVIQNERSSMLTEDFSSNEAQEVQLLSEFEALTYYLETDKEAKYAYRKCNKLDKDYFTHLLKQYLGIAYETEFALDDLFFSSFGHKYLVDMVVETVYDALKPNAKIEQVSNVVRKVFRIAEIKELLKELKYGSNEIKVAICENEKEKEETIKKRDQELTKMKEIKERLDYKALLRKKRKMESNTEELLGRLTRLEREYERKERELVLSQLEEQNKVYSLENELQAEELRNPKFKDILKVENVENIDITSKEKQLTRPTTVSAVGGRYLIPRDNIVMEKKTTSIQMKKETVCVEYKRKEKESLDKLIILQRGVTVLYCIADFKQRLPGGISSEKEAVAAGFKEARVSLSKNGKINYSQNGNVRLELDTKSILTVTVAEETKEVIRMKQELRFLDEKGLDKKLYYEKMVKKSKIKAEEVNRRPFVMALEMQSRRINMVVLRYQDFKELVIAFNWLVAN